MGKNKVIVLAVLEAGMSQSEAARRYGVSRRWVYELLRRYARDGDAGLEPGSRVPHSNPHQVPEVIQARILSLRHELTSAGLDAGAATIAWHLQRENLQAPAAATISRLLHQAGLVVPEPHKRPRSSLRRFEAAQPNETWQSDFTHWHLSNNHDVEILNFLDDHSRLLLGCTAHHRVTGPIVVEGFLTCTGIYGIPASTLTDNGMVYTTRLSGGKGGRNAFEHTLRTLGVKQKNGSPSHPQTQGKIERFHQTLKLWLTGQPAASTLEELNTQLDIFKHIYNEQRPHRALGRQTPLTSYLATPKATPALPEDQPHFRARMDRVDATGTVSLRYGGQLLHLGIGRAYKYDKVRLLIQDIDVIVIHHDTGEIIAEFILDDTKDYQAKKKHPDPKTEV
ncbi:transposase [Arthrobacter alpinus]|uniref:IS481 family transposase n=1 Tax=Arthrobacter alpinus TaxID=656366 RepID=UPI0005CAA1C9|nr:IS481 family transposase [Arthrobacter alpinus]ALV45366.1 transposase [Arthrobacter alpinus]ALV45617.1 transposase [Arthrobacter alpinus]ALV46908.1 transposase [Arthrobacter alpinus]